MNPVKNILRKYPQCWTLLYVFIYFPWFFMVEQKVTIASGFTIIHCPIDDLIPFCEYFVIPYFLWFFFVIASVLYFLFKRPKEEFYKLTALMFIGMTLSLIIYTVFPNGQTMRPPVDPNKNIFSSMIVALYKSDTCTNVFPSLHVFVSLAVNVGWWRSPVSSEKKWIKPASTLLAISICLSTVFLKQHSVLDGVAATIICFFLYIAIYEMDWTESYVRQVRERMELLTKKRSYRFRHH